VLIEIWRPGGRSEERRRITTAHAQRPQGGAQPAAGEAAEGRLAARKAIGAAVATTNSASRAMAPADGVVAAARPKARQRAQRLPVTSVRALKAKARSRQGERAGGPSRPQVRRRRRSQQGRRNKGGGDRGKRDKEPRFRRPRQGQPRQGRPVAPAVGHQAAPLIATVRPIRIRRSPSWRR
jgi:ATP-dependent RNA helicase SUPV3L1/SUV3